MATRESAAPRSCHFFCCPSRRRLHCMRARFDPLACNCDLCAKREGVTVWIFWFLVFPCSWRRCCMSYRCSEFLRIRPHFAQVFSCYFAVHTAHFLWPALAFDLVFPLLLLRISASELCARVLHITPPSISLNPYADFPFLCFTDHTDAPLPSSVLEFCR